MLSCCMEQILTKDALYLLSYISVGNEEYSSRFRPDLQGVLTIFRKIFLKALKKGKRA